MISSSVYWRNLENSISDNYSSQEMWFLTKIIHLKDSWKGTNANFQFLGKDIRSVSKEGYLESTNTASSCHMVGETTDIAHCQSMQAPMGTPARDMVSQETVARMGQVLDHTAHTQEDFNQIPMWALILHPWHQGMAHQGWAPATVRGQGRQVVCRV